jgi:hypothetical protein
VELAASVSFDHAADEDKDAVTLVRGQGGLYAANLIRDEASIAMRSIDLRGTRDSCGVSLPMPLRYARYEQKTKLGQLLTGLDPPTHTKESCLNSKRLSQVP